jgi:hypothetical protein
MSDETLITTKGYLTVLRGGRDKIKASDIITRTLSVGAATAKAGFFVTGQGEADGYVDLAVTTDLQVLGIILYPDVMPADTYDVEDTLADGTDVVILKMTAKGAKVACFLEALAGPVALEEGDPVCIGSEAGKVRKWAVTDATTDILRISEIIGKITHQDAGNATADQVVVVELGYP